ncbi:MAG: tyrosine-type recombinase/integrase, partial [Mobilitalea sp.]
VIDLSIMDVLLQTPNKDKKKGIRDRAILELLYATGIKVTELINLKVEDVNLSSKYITCGERRERNIPFGKSAKMALQDYIEVRAKNLTDKDNQTLFLNSTGEPLSRQGLWKILKTYGAEIGSDEINPNTIRHSFAAHLIENGADLGSVQEFLGHADITTTQVYLTQTYKNSREVYMNTHPRA